MWKFFSGFMLAALLGYWIYIEEQNEHLLFPRMEVLAIGDYARIAGSIVGEGKEEATGFTSWECSKTEMRCDAVTVDEVGHNHVALYDAETVAITEWTEDGLTINSKNADPNQCNYYEVRADFSTKTASYTRFPKSAEGNCAMLDQRIYNWRLADSLELRYPEDE